MTAYERPSFSVAQSGRAPEDCGHGWRHPITGACVFCGAFKVRAEKLLAELDAMYRPTPPEA